MEDNLAHRKSGTAGGTSLVRSQQAAPTLGSTAGATGGGGLCGGLSQNTPRLVSGKYTPPYKHTVYIIRSLSSRSFRSFRKNSTTRRFMRLFLIIAEFVEDP